MEVLCEPCQTIRNQSVCLFGGRSGNAQLVNRTGAPGFPSKITHGALAGTGSVPASEEKIYDAWVAWSRHQRFNGLRAAPDTAKPALLHRLDWYSSHNWTVAYPGDSRIFAPNQVPGRDLPAAFLGDD